MKPEIEIYSTKLYLNANGWRFSVLEIWTFNTVTTWCLFSISRRNKSSAEPGWQIEWCC